MWARLVVQRVLTLERRRVGLKVMEKEIYAIPLDLGKLYDELVRSMDDKPASLRMLRWICFATRPLTPDELRWAMIVDPDRRQRTLQDCRSAEEYVCDSKRMEGRVNALSCGLAEIVPSSDRLVVQFIHQSVQDFLLEKGLSVLHNSLEVAEINLSEPDVTGYTLHLLSKTRTRIVQFVRDFFVNKDGVIVGRAHYKLSRTCIRYLAMEEIAESTIRDGTGLVSAFPLLHYATTSWVAHVKQSEARNVSQSDLLSYFDWPSEALVRLWIRLYHAIEFFARDCPSFGASMVHIVSRYRLMEPLRMILQMADQLSTDIEAEDTLGRTPLSWAAGMGHEAVVKLLVERHDVNADSKDAFGRTPLSWAAEHGHESVVKLLAERDDVEADSKDTDGRTPLSWAADHGPKEVVKLLAERDDVEADSKDTSGRTPISWAAEHGHESVVKLLADRDDVEADSKDTSGRTPLSWAAERGHESVVKLLADRDDVEADSKDTDGQTPLSWAVEHGHESVVKLLADRDDVEADSKDTVGRTPLSRAARMGHEPVVKLLVERDDVEADSKDMDGRTPLAGAAMHGHEAVVKLLAERDDIDAGSATAVPAPFR